MIPPHTPHTPHTENPSLPKGPVGNPLVKLEAFKNFTASIKERCEQAPMRVEMQVIGAFDSLV